MLLFPGEPRSRYAFTLVEVLVVLIVVGLLAALLFPAFNRARNRAKLTECSNNQHQLYLGFATYAQDNDHRLPPYTSKAMQVASGDATAVEQSQELLDSLSSYLHSTQIWRCPSDTSVYVPGETQGNGADGKGLPVPHLTSYLFHGFQPAVSASASIRVKPFTGAADRGMLYDNFFRPCPAGPWDGYNQYNHQGQINMLYQDGHVKAMPENYALNCP